MEFFAANGTRPVRLCEETRAFAYESLNHKYGRETYANHGVAMDDYEGFPDLSAIEKYDAVVDRIARTAPLRICPNEKISGAATLRMGIEHMIPATYNDKPVFSSSISHLTIDFETVLKQGVDFIEKTAEESLKKHTGTDREPFIKSCLSCIRSMRLWHGRYLAALQGRPEYAENYRHLQHVPFAPAQNFYEAVQSLWFTFAFVRLCGNWPGIGRIDLLLKDYLEQDLADGTLTLPEAREILAHFFIKGCEWIKGGDCGSGDAQHYQNILLGGIDEDGNDVVNPVTYLVLDIIEELGISDFPTTVRINRHTDDKLLTRLAEVIRLGGGVIAVYNEDLIIESLVNHGYELKEARKFANDGCWEIQIPGKTYFAYIPFDSLQILQDTVLKKDGETVCFADFEALYAAYVTALQETVEELIARRNGYVFANTDAPVEEWVWRRKVPCTAVSVFEQGCIEKGLSYEEGGPVYNVVSPHIGGLPDTVNSLYAIKKLVFDDRKVTFAELADILDKDWEGNEPLRQYALNQYAYFGNDNDEVDDIARRLVADFARICGESSQKSAYDTPAGISTFGRQLNWAPQRTATPYGKKAHEVLAPNFSPTPGSDKEGATAIIKSYCKADLRQMVSGAALDIKLLPSAVNGDNGLTAIASLIRGFVALGGHFMQLDIADAALLRQAQEHPEDYQNLSVRVSGWNARFVTLRKEWQDMIIGQAGSEF